MQRSILGVFAALLSLFCFLMILPAFKKRRYGLAMVFLLNTLTNLILAVHAFYNTLF